MIDHILTLVKNGKLKYEYVFYLEFVMNIPLSGKCHRFIANFFSTDLIIWHTLKLFLIENLTSIEILLCRMELVPFEDFSTALDKALGKSGSHPKQVIRF